MARRPPAIHETLEKIETLNTSARPADAESEFSALVDTMDMRTLQEWEQDLRLTLAGFFPKRRRRLEAELDRRLKGGQAAPTRVAHLPPLEVDASSIEREFAASLSNLSEHHIFQWSTAYRDTLARFFERFLRSGEVGTDGSLLVAVTQHLSHHAYDIFSKGYHHLTRRTGEGRQYAVTKSLAGLQRFLDLPIEFYSAQLSSPDEDANADALRCLTSSMVGAILLGYASVDFELFQGSQVLPRFPRAWTYALPFLRGEELSALLDIMEAGDFNEGLVNSVKPLIEGIDELCARGGDYLPLPALGQITWDTWRLDVSLIPPPHSADSQLIQTQCYLDASFVRPAALEEAVGRNVKLIVAPLRPDLVSIVSANTQLQSVIVNTADPRRLESAKQRVVSVLEYVVYERSSPRVRARPIQFNFARNFPLHNPFLTRYFHVHRQSIRDLLGMFERRNGVRLWCSVRRSGKTTACLDLGGTAGNSAVVSQTCDNTGQIPDGSLFYDRVCTALDQGRQLPGSFFMDTVEACSPQRPNDVRRFVFILDEYETLFGRLRGAVRREPDLRYTVVQPLLNEMVAFTRDNLLVFLGQQPNAHFILMDQNQLSAYVEQESFPLFRHDPDTLGGEFVELLRKVLSDRLEFDLAFANAVFAETAGHPFLTVNLLVEFVEWLIEIKRPMAGLVLTGEDFTAFTRAKLKRSHVSLSAEYRWFREAASHATSSDSREQIPWLYAVYSTLREVCASSPQSLRATRRDFFNIVLRLGIPDLGFTPEALLDTATQANFFEFDEHYVWPKIRLLGRIVAVTQGQVVA